MGAQLREQTWTVANAQLQLHISIYQQKLNFYSCSMELNKKAKPQGV